MNTVASSLEADFSPEHPSLQRNLETDVVVIGAGVAGLTTALRLLRNGRRVAVLAPLGVTSDVHDGAAPLTELLDTRYHQLEAKLGYREASLVATSARLAIDCVEKLSRELGVRFERVPAFLFAERDDDARLLGHELDALKRAGAEVDRVRRPLPIPVTAAVRLERQALFEPRAYVQALARRFVAEGGRVFENTEVLGLEDGEPCLVQAREANVRCRDVVLTIDAPGLSRFVPRTTVQTRSATPAAPMASELPSGLYVDLREPGHCTHVSKSFGPSTQRSRGVVTSFDGLPLIGRSPSARRVFIATAFGSTDITFATVAALVLGDVVRGVSNSCAELFVPSRAQPRFQRSRRARSSVADDATGPLARH